MAYLKAPDGGRIIGTLERIPGVARILTDSFQINSTSGQDGLFNFDYEGGTDVDWDGQETIFRKPTAAAKSQKPERVFVDDGGDEWLESELELVDDAEDEDEGDGS